MLRVSELENHRSQEVVVDIFVESKSNTAPEEQKFALQTQLKLMEGEIDGQMLAVDKIVRKGKRVIAVRGELFMSLGSLKENDVQPHRMARTSMKEGVGQLWRQLESVIHVKAVRLQAQAG